MKNFLISGASVLMCVAMLPDDLFAHGGQYRGPQDVVPPSSGGGRGPGRSGGGPAGPQTGGPGGPSIPAPSGPSTGGAPRPGGPGGPGAPTTGGGGGYTINDDLTAWKYWWEFNKDPFIRLRDAVHTRAAQTGDDDYYIGSRRKSASRDTLKPTEQDIINEILPALKKAIDSTEQRDITSSCMVAMGKIGRDHPEFRLIDVFRPRLTRGDQEIRETAALALGISTISGEDELALLVGLARDDAAGREVSGGRVNNRTRAFAMYGLGLTAHETSSVDIKRQAFEAMKAVLEDDKIRDRNVKVAAINGMAILNISAPNASTAEQQLLADVLSTLDGYYLRRAGAGTNLILAHCPTAVAKLLGRNHPDRALVERYKKMFAADLVDKGQYKRAGNDIGQSCAIALGQLCKPYDKKDSPDARYSQLLLEQWNKHKDQQTKYYSLLSLGWIGGQLNRTALIRAFDKGNKALEKPWAALALGVYSHLQYQEQDRRKEPAVVDHLIGETLLEGLEKSRTPDLTGALAIGLGLTRYLEAADLMRERLLESQGQEEMAGYLAVGLALMGDTASKESIREVVASSARRFTLLQQAAIALGKLGDKQVADQLLDLMTDGEPNLAKLSSIASAIGFIGDRRSIRPLQDMLFDEDLGDLSRAFAAVALGGVADKEPLPWNSKIGTNMNYRAAVETLTNGMSGILDIL